MDSKDFIKDMIAKAKAGDPDLSLESDPSVKPGMTKHSLQAGLTQKELKGDAKVALKLEVILKPLTIDASRELAKKLAAWFDTEYPDAVYEIEGRVQLDTGPGGTSKIKEYK